MIKLYKLLLISSLFFSITAYADNWQLAKKEKGIQVYTRNISGSPLKAFKGIVTLPTHLAAIIATINDTSAYTQLFHKAKYAQELKRISKTESYRYIVTALPWPIKNRDSIIHSTLKQNPKSKVVQITLNAAPNYIPQKPNLVRIQKLTGRWLLIPEKDQVKVIYEISVSPGGNLPMWLINSMSVDIPFITLKNLRNLVKQDKYQKAKLSL